MDHKNEAEIVARVLNGERQAYALLVEEYKTPIYNLAYRMTRNSQDAEDLAQETFLRSFNQLFRYDKKQRFYTWLYTISLNIIRNHLKKNSNRRRDNFRQREKASGMVDLDGKQVALQESRDSYEGCKEREEELESCLQKLSPELRELLILRFYQGLPFEAIAEITGLSLSAIKMRVYRGLEKLRKYIGENVTSDR
ncbi:MAG: RNA polymerase [Deltaproteobacteria bacterium HGW-Deltaproteobacteria-2]|jgi:RNA polymerase sigma-70 factor (ECF subfamily)|nr:MAG: RNA polymerase [Deltaproteobacteria bacterium HGW-Deltaproteobacteria-2]